MRAVVRSDEIEDLVGTVGQTFLGVTVNCARCHDHKFDPVRQKEYYRIASALSGVRHGERDLAAVDPTAAAIRAQIKELQSRIEAIEKPARERVLADRGKLDSALPEPIVAWNFEKGAGRLEGGAGALARGWCETDERGNRVRRQDGARQFDAA